MSLLCPSGIRWRGHFVELDTKRIVYWNFVQPKCHGDLFVCGVRFFVETSEELMNGWVRPGVCRQVVLGLVLPETFGKLRQQQLADSLAGLSGLLSPFSFKFSLFGEERRHGLVGLLRLLLLRRRRDRLLGFRGGG